MRHHAYSFPGLGSHERLSVHANTLMVALENHIESIVIPAFCGECGEVSTKVIGRLMYEAYKQVMNPLAAINRDYAERRRPELQYAMEGWKE